MSPEIKRTAAEIAAIIKFLKQSGIESIKTYGKREDVEALKLAIAKELGKPPSAVNT